MAGSNNFTGQNIQDTYQRVLQISSSGEVADGTGSALPISFKSGDLTITNNNLRFAGGPSIFANTNDTLFYVSGGGASLQTNFTTNLKLSDGKGLIFGQDGNFRIMHSVDKL